MTVTQNQYASALGATPTSDGRWNFTVWAPHHERLELHLLGDRPAFVPMRRDERGYHLIDLEDVGLGQNTYTSSRMRRNDPTLRRAGNRMEYTDLRNLSTCKISSGRIAIGKVYSWRTACFTNCMWGPSLMKEPSMPCAPHSIDLPLLA